MAVAELARAWWPLLQLALTVAVGAAMLWVRATVADRTRALEDTVGGRMRELEADLSARLAAHGERLVRLEEAQRHMPRAEDLHALRQDMAALQTQLAGVVALMPSIQSGLDRVNAYLLEATK